MLDLVDMVQALRERKLQPQKLSLQVIETVAGIGR